ncbi:MFS transporter [Flavobacterium sp.]|uniref:MFS transporter n=1 Tax=Flavobacterium sp. TaxID=239 RepID=UPI001209E1CF|nr:MFS transporter [Flavobacterium sp.]RZJ69098.1 MAG: MFS transporter [Flavobacterium sp.]
MEAITRTSGIPALSENTSLRYLNFVALYISQGIPEGMVLFGIPAWLAMNGKSAGEIASFAVAFGLPWSFKAIVAPMMDRFAFLPMGRKRPWVLFGQTGLILSLLALAFVPNPLQNLDSLMIGVFFVGCFGAMQDVATDGMAIDVIPEKQQARANGLMWGSKIAGNSASLALGSYLINAYGFKVAILTLAVSVGLIMLAPLFLRERPGEKILPWTHGDASEENKATQPDNWSVIFKSLYRVFSLKNSLILAAVAFCFQAAFNYLDTLLPIFTVQHLGWSDQEYSNFYATAALIGGLGGMLFGGILIDRFGKIKMLNIYILLLLVTIGTFALLENFWQNRLFICGFMIAIQIFYVFSVIGIFATAMQCCWKKVSASQFTIFMTLSNLGRIAGASIVGLVRTHLSWQTTMLVFAGILLLTAFVLQFLSIKKQVSRISQWEKEETEILEVPAIL